MWSEDFPGSDEEIKCLRGSVLGPNIALMKTERVYYYNSYLKEFKAQVIKTVSRENGLAVYLDRTAFYPESGG